MRLRVSFPAPLLLVLSSATTLAPRTARAQVIFISPCGLEIPPFSLGILKIWVCLEGPIRDGIIGARFRVTGLPPGWITEAVPSQPGSTVTGDLFGDGVFLSFSCATGVGVYLELLTVALFATDARTDVLLAATAIDPVPAPPFDCPYVFLCDPPAFTKQCGFGAYINPRKLGCPLAANATSWSEIKELYR